MLPSVSPAASPPETTPVAEIDRHAGGRAEIARGVDAVAAGQRIGPGRPFERVVAVAAVELVVAGAAQDVVVPGLAEDLVVLAAGVDLVIADAAMDRVDPGPADQPVGAVAAGERVVPRLAGERVVAAIADEGVVAELAADDVADVVAGQGVVVAGAVQVLDVGQDVARRVAAAVDAGQQVDRDRRRRALVIGEVRAGAAVEDIGPRPAAELVVAGAAAERIGRGGAVQPVVEVRPDEVLDAGQRVALGVAAGAGSRDEVDDDPDGGGRIVRRVDPVAAEEASAPAPPTSVSSPLAPRRSLTPPSPVRVSAKADPTRFSMLSSVSPAASPPEAAPLSRLTETAAAEVS